METNTANAIFCLVFWGLPTLAAIVAAVIHEVTTKEN